jgi:hypothetical protein
MTEKLFKNKWVVWFFFFVITLLLYFPSRHAGFVTDFIEYYITAKSSTFLRFVFSNTAIGCNNNFWFITHCFLWTLFKWFPINSIGYYVVSSVLHSFCALLLMQFILCFKKYSTQNLHPISFIAAFLFLIAPIQTEAMVWRVAQHYFVALSFQLIIFILILKYADKGIKKYYAFALLLYFLSLFTLEYFFVTPIIVGLLFWVDSNFSFKQKSLLNSIYRTSPFILLLGIYFLSFKIVYGVWVAHYGANIHSSIFAPMAIGNWLKMPIKMIGFQYWQPELYFKCLQFIEKNWWLGLASGIIVTILVLLFKTERRIIISWLLIFALTLFPTVSLWLNYITWFENDRHIYIASAFFFSILVFVGFKILKKNFGVFVIFYVLLLGSTTFYLNTLWAKSAEITNHLATTLKGNTTQPIILLNTPDSYKGAHMFRTYSVESSVMWQGNILYHNKINSQCFDAVRYIYSEKDKPFIVKQISNDTLLINLELHGGWINAVYDNSSNKNSFFKVIYSPDKSWEYRVIIIDRKVNPILYLFNGKDWEEVKLKNVAVKNMLSGEQKICNELEMMEVEKG